MASSSHAAPAPGNRIDVGVMDLFRFDDEMLVEHQALMGSTFMREADGRGSTLPGRPARSTLQR